jgi:cytohesin
MSDIKFNCPQCGQHIAVDATAAGMTVVCPQCSLAILVPQPAQLAGQEPPRRAKRWWLLSAGIAAAMLIAGLLIWQAPWRKTTAAGTAAASSKSAENSRSAKANGKPIHPSAPALPDDLARGLVMHFNFDAEPIEGKIPDLSGQGNDGEAVGIQWDAQGHQGGSVVFGPTNNYIRVPNSDSLNPSNITLAVWIKAGKQGDPVRRVFDKNHADGYALSIGGEHHGAAGKIFVEIDMKVKNHACAGSDNPVTDGRWHHLAATYNGAEEIFYVDGVPQQGVERWKGIIPANSQDLTLGANRSNPNAALGEVGASFNGMMDDAMVFNRALSAEEIQRLYALQKTKADAPPANIEIFALPKAAYEGNLEEVKALVAKGADINAQWPKDANFTPLFFAVIKGHEYIRRIFDSPGFKKFNELKDLTKNVDYPRQYAEIVSLLLANGADINAKDSYNRTPLLLSLGLGYSDMAKLLIAKGADVNAKDKGETTPLLSAALDNNKDMEKLLMAKGAKVDIFTASAMGDIERVKGFLNSNPSMINATQGVFTPFHAAAFSGQTEMMKFLMGKGADVNAGYPEKQTPLYWAAYKGHLDAAELLIAKGAIINSESSNSPSPLFGAAWGGNKEIGELLIAKGADVNAKDRSGWTPLFTAAMTDKGSNDMVELLIAKGADVNAKDIKGRTPLWATANENRLERARLLVSKGADVNAKGGTALHISARFGYKDYVEFLLANGADVRAIESDGWTPLHHAALGGNKEIVEMLLAKGADANARDKDGKTPFIVARDEGYPDIAELIKKHQDKNPPKTVFVPPEALKRGLILHFDFDTNLVAGKIPDLSGQENNGKPVGVQWVTNGYSSSSTGDGSTNNGAVSAHENHGSQTALRFNGTATTYVVVPRSASLEPQDAITVSLWCKGVPGTGQNYGIILRKADDCAAGYFIRTANADGSDRTETFRLDPPNPCAGGNASVAPFTPSTDLSWQHLAATYSSNDGLITYVNGVLISRTPPMGQLQHSGDLFIGGATVNNQDGGFNGLIKEVRIYNRALSADEVQALFDSQKTAKSSGGAPVPTETAGKSNTAERRKQIKDLYDQGLIGKDAYDKRKAEILGSQP